MAVAARAKLPERPILVPTELNLRWVDLHAQSLVGAALKLCILSLVSAPHRNLHMVTKLHIAQALIGHCATLNVHKMNYWDIKSHRPGAGRRACQSSLKQDIWRLSVCSRLDVLLQLVMPVVMPVRRCARMAPLGSVAADSMMSTLRCELRLVDRLSGLGACRN